MRIPLTLQQLEAFAQVAQLGSFRAAAQALHVSQPALSRTVQLAESLLSVRLFDRDTRHVELTAAGRELLPLAQRLLAEFDSGFSDLARFLEGRSGRVRLGVLPSVGTALVPQAMAQFRQTWPQVEFSVMEAPADPLLAAVLEGTVDFALTVQPPPTARQLQYEQLLDDPFVLVCPSHDALAAQRSVSWAAFKDRPFITSAHQSSIRPLVDDILLRKRITVNAALEYPSIASCGAMVAAGLGITALPRLAVSLIATPGVATVPLQASGRGRRIGLVSREARTPSPISQSFRDLLRRQMNAMKH